MAESELTENPTEVLRDLVASPVGENVGEEIEAYLGALPPGEISHTLNIIEEETRTRVFELLNPEAAADLLEHFADDHAAEIIDDLATEHAADILDELDSDDQADILGELEPEDAEAILEEMEPEEAADARALIGYADDVVGGIMHREFVAFPPDRLIDDVVTDLRRNQEKYAEFDVSAVYVVAADGVLKGVVRLRDILLAPGKNPVSTIRIDDAATLEVEMSVDEAENYFDRHGYAAVAVVDKERKILGVVRREAVEEASSEKAQRALAQFGGIVGGEELRTMSARSRVVRRLAFLIPNVLLLMVSASVIALFEGTIERVTALAIFLPVIAGSGGCAGNQAVAVSIRELALGLVRPTDVVWVVSREAVMGLIIGLVLGAIVFVVTWVWRGSPYLGLVVGMALPVSIFVAVTLGGAVPLVLHGLKIDPAMASGPILMTTVDFFAFFSVLVTAQLMIDKLAPVGEVVGAGVEAAKILGGG